MGEDPGDSGFCNQTKSHLIRRSSPLSHPSIIAAIGRRPCSIGTGPRVSRVKCTLRMCGHKVRVSCLSAEKRLTSSSGRFQYPPLGVVFATGSVCDWGGYRWRQRAPWVRAETFTDFLRPLEVHAGRTVKRENAIHSGRLSPRDGSKSRP